MAGNPPKLSQRSAAKDTGLSPHQQKQAVRVASVPDEEFTDMVESENPPTVTKLADMGTKKQNYRYGNNGLSPHPRGSYLNILLFTVQRITDLCNPGIDHLGRFPH